MIRLVVVDSSVWIDFLRGHLTPATALLRHLIDAERVITADLVLTEVLRGTTDDRAFELARQRLALGRPMTVSDSAVGLQAARNFRTLRGLGVTVRGTVDNLIATRCILDDLPLLFSDRDFEPFVRHLGLRPALRVASGVN